ncbi:DNA polymerase III subunit delta [Ammoniphilus sp. CFH 90114]|uniref:DNA polymerase III subunit delta n=1 Tax=Ammoniphilus sp. CFH 90114 TaxID=2493665 RepID=UPI00100E83D7|nr:DNA polymerase III subunit delta [Ammoniphilus sp. CFH 90114]RXT14805.1 DNA polymerase III subunit delta [Ammoniphilus sp. CFH 90114]
MEYRSIFKEIQQGIIKPIYLLYGTEAFLIEECINFIKTKAIDEQFLDFNFSVFDLNEIPIQQAVMDAETLPFMGDKRVVVAKNAHFLTGAKASGGVDHSVDSLQAYLDNPTDTSILILTVFQDKLDERKKVVKGLKSVGAVVPFMPLKDQELWGWIKRQAQKRGVQMDDHSAQTLDRIVGNDLRRLQQEMDKMASYVGQGGLITEEVVYSLGSRTLEQDIFGLIDKASRLDIDQAMRIYYDLLKNKEEPLTILSLLARQFRLILQVKILSARGYSGQQMASILGVHPYPIKLAAEKAQRFKEKALRRIIAYLAEEDYRIKTGQIDKSLSMELFFMRLRDMLES